MSATVDVEYYIKNNYPWTKLPATTKQGLGNSQKEYDKAVLTFSVKNQLRYKGNLVKLIKRDERRYYDDLLQYSREHLMLYPYHLADVIVKGLRVTPFNYYIGIMTDIMNHDKSYDCLPNFTAADCLRLLGIGRNQYIDLMNQCRSSKKFFRKKPVRDLLPMQPVEIGIIDSWWQAQTGFISEEDIRVCTPSDKKAIDTIIDSGAQLVGDLDIKTLHGLYRKGLVYLDVPIEDEDCIVVPPLEGFVMNRVTGDYFETLLYKIFVSIDEHTPVAEVASVLQIDLQLVKNAVSVYCRLGFAKKKTLEMIHEHDLHLSWKNLPSVSKSKSNEDQLLLDWKDTILQAQDACNQEQAAETSSLDNISENSQIVASVAGRKRIAFLFDSTLTAFLMMGNLSPGLKSHAVTMFEVGKLSDESMDSFLCELEKVGCEAEGEARRYFDHAITLRDTVKFLRYNAALNCDPDNDGPGPGIDLIRCESLLGLDVATRARILNKNYELLVSMAPLSNEIRPVSSCTPQHIGPAIPEVSSVWFKLYLYHITGSGPPSVLLVKGAKLRRLPAVLQEYDKLLVTTWGHDPAVIAASNILLTLNDALTHSAVLVQAHGWQTEGRVMFIPFPLIDEPHPLTQVANHPCIRRLSKLLRLQHSAGFITLLNTCKDKPSAGYSTGDNDSDICLIKSTATSSSASIEVLNEPQNGLKDVASAQLLASELAQLQSSTGLCLELQHTEPDAQLERDWTLLDCSFGMPLFNSELNKAVCTRILTCDLCCTLSLQKLLESSRTMSLKLLDFISQLQDSTASTVPYSNPHTVDACIPYPTQSLLFSEGTLTRWDGR